MNKQFVYIYVSDIFENSKKFGCNFVKNNLMYLYLPSIYKSSIILKVIVTWIVTCYMKLCYIVTWNFTMYILTIITNSSKVYLIGKNIFCNWSFFESYFQWTFSSVTEMGYFARTKFSLVHKKNFSLMWLEVFKLGYVFC